MDRNLINTSAIAAPDEAIPRSLTSAIRQARPQEYLATVGDIHLEVSRFAAKGHCELESIPGFDYDTNLSVIMGRLVEGPMAGGYAGICPGRIV